VLDVEYTDGTTVQVKILVADRIAVGATGKGTVDAMQSNPMDYQARLVHAAMLRLGLARDVDYADWLPTVADLDMAEASANPTGTGTGATP
jgi:hypothetical protein